MRATPLFHRLLLENDEVRVLETRIGPGEVPVHTHCRLSVLTTLATAHFVRRDGEGAVLGDSRAAGSLPEAGTCVWLEAMPPHSVKPAHHVAEPRLHVSAPTTRRPGQARPGSCGLGRGTYSPRHSSPPVRCP